MIAGSLLRISFDSLWANKLRSTLTLLGVILGVTSVMTIISAIEGFMGSIEKELSQLGPSTFIIERIGIVTSEEMFLDKIKRKPLTMESAELLSSGCSLCSKVSARTYWRSRVKYGSEALRNVIIMGTQPNFVDIVDYNVALGRFLSIEDERYRKNAAFIGETVRQTFFSGVDPLGKEIKIDGHRYTVIGVAEKSKSAFGGDDEDNYIIIPLSTHIKQFGEPRRGFSIFVKAASLDVLPDAMDEARIVLRAQRHVPYDKEDDFDILTADNILELLNQFTKMIRIFLVGVSSISVVVGGIVVMNIMMVSVTERTREIGIRKSLGAKRQHILTQFLFESLMLTLGGGMIGIALGFLAARGLIAKLGMDISPSALAIFVGLSISTCVGLFFGIYPAMKAARLDPVKALSYE
jgi:putative ABC transport system permease protein